MGKKNLPTNKKTVFAISLALLINLIKTQAIEGMYFNPSGSSPIEEDSSTPYRFVSCRFFTAISCNGVLAGSIDLTYHGNFLIYKSSYDFDFSAASPVFPQTQKISRYPQEQEVFIMMVEALT